MVRCNQCLSPLMLWVRISTMATYTTLCDKVCQSLATGRWFSLGTPVSSTNKTEILLKVVLSILKQSIILIYLEYQRVALVEQQLLIITFRSIRVLPGFCRGCVTQSTVFCIVFCRSMFVLLFFLFVYYVLWFMSSLYCVL